MSNQIKVNPDFNRNSGIEGKTSTKYVAVNSQALINHFTAQGYSVRKASGKAVKGKHVFRLQHNDLQFSGVDSYRPEIVIMNSYDGSCSLRILLGIFRLVCSNGMVVGTSFTEYSIKHIGKNTMEQVNAAVAKITQDAIRLGTIIKKFQSITLSDEQKFSLAYDSMNSALKTLNKSAVIKPENVVLTLKVRRDADQASDLWSVLNVVQENITRYGFTAQDALTGRSTNIRSIKSAARDITVNRMLWDNAEKLADQLAA